MTSTIKINNQEKNDYFLNNIFIFSKDFSPGKTFSNEGTSNFPA